MDILIVQTQFGPKVGAKTEIELTTSFQRNSNTQIHPIRLDYRSGNAAKRGLLFLPLLDTVDEISPTKEVKDFPY